ncbi:MAG: hypothetical protein AAGC70_01590 [Pseudomonadota bacterium]
MRIIPLKYRTGALDVRIVAAIGAALCLALLSVPADAGAPGAPHSDATVVGATIYTASPPPPSAVLAPEPVRVGQPALGHHTGGYCARWRRICGYRWGWGTWRWRRCLAIRHCY